MCVTQAVAAGGVGETQIAISNFARDETTKVREATQAALRCETYGLNHSLNGCGGWLGFQDNAIALFVALVPSVSTNT